MNLKNELCTELGRAAYKKDFNLIKKIVLEATENGLIDDMDFRNTVLSDVMILCEEHREIVDYVCEKVFKSHSKYNIYYETCENIINNNISKVVEAIENNEISLDFRMTEFEPTLMQFAVEKGSDELIKRLYLLPNAVRSILNFDIYDVNCALGSHVSGLEWLLNNDRLALFKKLINDNHIELKYYLICETKYKSDCFNFIVNSIPDSINHYFSYCIKYHMNKIAIEIFNNYDIDLNYDCFLRGNHLNVACVFSNTEMIDFLLDKGINVNSCDDDYHLYAYRSIFYNNDYDIDAKRSILKSLIDKGADIHHKDNNGENLFFELADTPTNFRDEIFLAHELGIEYCKNNNGYFPLDYITKVAKFFNPVNKKALEDLETQINVTR